MSITDVDTVLEDTPSKHARETLRAFGLKATANSSLSQGFQVVACPSFKFCNVVLFLCSSKDKYHAITILIHSNLHTDLILCLSYTLILLFLY